MSTTILRSRILDMAIRGQLVPQDPNEGTADDLLKTIAAQRGKPITPITDNVPFEIPANWRWVKLGDISNYGECISKDVRDLSKDAWILELEDLEKGSARIIQRITLQDRQIKGIRREFHKGAILYSKLRTYLNKVLIAPSDGYCTTEIVPFDTLCYNPFVCQILRSPYYLGYTAQLGYGVKMPRMSTTDVKRSLIPLPPLSEQHRIVAKVEELLGEVDKIEHAQTDITHAATTLRSRILDMAIQGELTHSNTDEWESVSLIDVCKVIMGQSPAGDSYNPTDGIEFHQGKTFFGEKYLKPSHIYTNSPTKLAEAHSIVISVRAPVGTSNIVDRQICIGRGLAAICPKSNADLMFIYYLLESRSCLSYLNDNATGTTFKAISGDILKKYSFPLPPLSEQRRIVAKIEELFAEIDKLK